MKRTLAKFSFLATAAISVGATGEPAKHPGKPLLRAPAWGHDREQHALGVWLDRKMSAALGSCPTHEDGVSDIPNDLYTDGKTMWSIVSEESDLEWKFDRFPEGLFMRLYPDDNDPKAADLEARSQLALPQTVTLRGISAYEANCKTELVEKAAASASGFGLSADVAQKALHNDTANVSIQIADYTSNLHDVFSTVGSRWEPKAAAYQVLALLYADGAVTEATRYLARAKIIRIAVSHESGRSNALSASGGFDVMFAKGGGSTSSSSNEGDHSSNIWSALVGGEFVHGSAATRPDLAFYVIPRRSTVLSELRANLLVRAGATSSVVLDPLNAPVSPKLQYPWASPPELMVSVGFRGGEASVLPEFCEALVPVGKPFGLAVVGHESTPIDGRCLLQIQLAAATDPGLRNNGNTYPIEIGLKEKDGVEPLKDLSAEVRFEYEHAAFYKRPPSCTRSAPAQYDCELPLQIVGRPKPGGVVSINTTTTNPVCSDGTPVAYEKSIPLGRTLVVRPTHELARPVTCRWDGYVGFRNGPVDEKLNTPSALLELDPPTTATQPGSGSPASAPSASGGPAVEPPSSN